MARFSSFDGLELSYAELGEGPPTLLLHGFASDSDTNWVRPGVAAAIAGSGRRVVLLDARGHGRSDKPHDTAAYADRALARDVQALLDRLALPSVDLVGYSMGAFVAMDVAVVDPRVRSLVLGGAGRGRAGAGDDARAELIAAGLEAPDAAAVTDPTARAFRSFADATGADRLALAALQRVRPLPPSYDVLHAINLPTLIIHGEKDTLAGRAEAMSEAIPGARLVVVPGDHISAVVKPEFRQEVVAFLSEQAGRP